ncbi:MAG: hypothetical protein NT013_26270 [Planctomycetia bacterium]|nr:hypothetical protein [Planctomycetia bacterium]
MLRRSRRRLPPLQLRRTQRPPPTSGGFHPVALSRTDRIAAYLETHPQFRLTTPYAAEA